MSHPAFESEPEPVHGPRAVLAAERQLSGFLTCLRCSNAFPRDGVNALKCCLRLQKPMLRCDNTGKEMLYMATSQSDAGALRLNRRASDCSIARQRIGSGEQW
ncbi:hypothetical protein BAQU_1663 [Bifidobacterium aquikefiri]|uniref:Uncharacterized protein n=1 Tax=Bifidobacterium aquikefiri TaxID=1653207 RepID=A0A261G237_9BIFI|nr:hypothetical protein BAQU_1663 [Bifidobacterium aquikefiri]